MCALFQFTYIFVHVKLFIFCISLFVQDPYDHYNSLWNSKNVIEKLLFYSQL